MLRREHIPSRKPISFEDRVPKLKEERNRKAKKKLKRFLFASFMLILTILYLHSPYAKVETVTIEGTKYLTDEEITEWCGVDEETIFLSTRNNKIENKLLTHPEIKSVEAGHKFPNELTIHIEENEVVGYFTEEDKLYPVLETGVILKDRVVTYSVQLPVFINFEEGKTFEKTVTEISQLSDEVFNNISEVCYSPSEGNEDLIYIFMNDGNMVKTVPSSLAENMSHYPSIVAQLEGKKGVIDMEVGIYFKTYDSIKKSMSSESIENTEETPSAENTESTTPEETPAE